MTTTRVATMYLKSMGAFPGARPYWQRLRLLPRRAQTQHRKCSDRCANELQAAGEIRMSRHQVQVKSGHSPQKNAPQQQPPQPTEQKNRKLRETDEACHHPAQEKLNRGFASKCQSGMVSKEINPIKIRLAPYARKTTRISTTLELSSRRESAAIPSKRGRWASRIRPRRRNGGPYSRARRA